MMLGPRVVHTRSEAGSALRASSVVRGRQGHAAAFAWKAIRSLSALGTAGISRLRRMPMVFEQGPYLTVAAICDKALQEKDGVISLIRVVDKLTSSAVGPDAPEQMPPFPVNLSLVIMLRAGETSSTHTITIRPQAPAPTPSPPETEVPVSFSGVPGEGTNLVVNLAFVTATEGQYWFDILLDGHLLSRVPCESSTPHCARDRKD